MVPCIIDFIGANALLGPVGGGARGPGHSWALKWHRAKRSNLFAPMKSIMHGAIRIIGQ